MQEEGVKLLERESILPVSSLNNKRCVRLDHFLDLLFSLSKGQREVVYGVVGCCVGHHFFCVAVERFQTRLKY